MATQNDTARFREVGARLGTLLLASGQYVSAIIDVADPAAMAVPPAR